MLDLREVLVGAVAGGEERGARLEAEAHLEDVLDDLGVELGLQPPGEHVAVEQVPLVEGQHARSDLRRHLDEALAGEALHRLAHGRAADAVIFTEFALDRQRGAGQEFARDDAAADVIGNLRAHRSDR